MSNQHIRFDESNDSVYSTDTDHLQGVVPEKSSSDDTREAFGIYSENENSDIAVSDVEGQQDTDIPDIRAWGKGKKKYYSTDYVDKDRNFYQDKDALLTDLEEEEARLLQLQLVEQLQDTDFHFDMLTKQSKEDITRIEETVTTDVSKLTKRQKINIFQADSPEFCGLVQDCKEKFVVIKNILKILKINSGLNELNGMRALGFLKKYLQLILNYLLNVNVYLLLKSQKAAVKTHPVIKRLYQYRKLLNKMDYIFHQLESQQIQEMPLVYQETQNKLKCEIKSVQDINIQQKKNALENIRSSVLMKLKDDRNYTPEIKRPITYQIAKNKGLLPHRKKEQRNPRIKNRMKYRKATIRRKGAVRKVQNELTRYSGEISGIKSTVKKSISINS